MVSTEVLSNAAIMTTAHKRPKYLKQTLGAWAGARGIEHISRFYVALGVSPLQDEQLGIIGNFADKIKKPVFVVIDNPPVGPSRAIGQMAHRAFADSDIDFLIFGEEDILVGDDMLELMSWGKETYASDERVLMVNGHSHCGNGWDGPNVKDDPNADESIIRLETYFHPWCWGTWRDRWEQVIEPTWDWDLTTGSFGYDNGYEWNLATRIMPRGDYVAPTPDVSRSQHIGKDDGWASTPEVYLWGLSHNFREHRDPVTFEVKEVIK